MSLFERYAPDALMDWGKVFNGDYLDPYSGKTWVVQGAQKRGGDVFEGTGCLVSGATQPTLLNLPFTPQRWSLACFVNETSSNQFARYLSIKKAGLATGNWNNYIDIFALDGSTLVARTLNNGGGNSESQYAKFQRNKAVPQFIVLTFEMGLLSVWVNGKKASSTQTVDLGADWIDFRLCTGDDGVANNLYGLFGNCALFNRVLSSVEIASMWQDALPVPTVPCTLPFLQLNQSSRKFTGGIVCPQVSASRADGTAGAGSLLGTVKIQISPTKQVPARRKVRIFDTVSGKLLAETWSDQITGIWRVDGLALDRLFTVLSHDHEKEFNAVTADYRYAEVL